MKKGEYYEKLKDPRWQKKRLEIMERDGWRCAYCDDTKSTLTVHHTFYKMDADPWDYPSESLLTLCQKCHQAEADLRQDCERKLLEGIKNLSAQDVHYITNNLKLLLTNVPADLKPPKASYDIFSTVLYMIMFSVGHKIKNPDFLQSLLKEYQTIKKENEIPKD